jgi:uncharacterized protein YlxW (UPF0749 family)
MTVSVDSDGPLGRAGHALGRAGRRVRGGAGVGGAGAASAATKAVILLVTGLVGFLLVGQIRTSQRVTRQLSAESEGDLARILSDLNTGTDNLRDQVGTLKLQLFSLQTSTRRDDTAVRTAAEQLDALAVLAGTVPATGPGVTVVVDDPESAVRYDQLINLIEELRDAGAEAIAVNGQRVGGTSAFVPATRGILLTGAGAPTGVLTPPYSVTAIGEPATLDTALNIPGGALDTLRAQRGVTAGVQRAAKVDVPALATPPSFRVARPVGSGG